MSLHDVNTISNRLSLRKPQRDSLEILQRICEIATLEKDADNAELLAVIQSEFSNVKSFDRDFLSLCFALATGVGKTRLMGAFISYLYMSEGIKHFFVIAPNLTIYNKLIADFTPNTPKYVFKGIGEFARNQPLIITGENYENGYGIRGTSMFDEEIHINIFNISKITAKDKGHYAKDDERKNVPRFRRLREEIGESYFDYLAGLDDLVVLMDESHRYRASAGMAAINELKPIIGLELTATPHVERGQKTIPFNNVIYNYPLASAMDDGFVKEPAVATRENFDFSNYTEEGLEKIKLEDGILLHENTKVDLEVFAKNNEKEIVKPFMLVVAQDTSHANELQLQMESDNFFDGKYKGKIITVHSKNTKGSEGDEIVKQLLTVEDPANPIEIVIHVNMLKEGWDVTNLYTIVPLRAANSKTLVEQSIGRGLRLPYGKRVGVPAVDRLSIVSHDKFQEIVDHANDPGSIIRSGIVIGRNIPEKGKKAVVIKPSISSFLNNKDKTKKESNRQSTDSQTSTNTVKEFTTEEESEVATVVLEVIRKYENLKSSDELQNTQTQKEIVEKVKEIITPRQKIFDFDNRVNVNDVVKKTTMLYQKFSIDIPKIIVVPKGEVTCGYNDFTLDVSGVNYQPVEQTVLIQHLHDKEVYKIKSGDALSEETRPEDFLVRGLIEFNDISYDDHAAILYDLSSQLVKHLRTYLEFEDDVLNVLQFHQQLLVRLIHSQMQDHFVESATEYEATVTKGFRTLSSSNCTIAEEEDVRDFRLAIPDGKKNQIKSMIFGGFDKCLYPVQKFDSDPERRFAVVLENDKTVQKWFKPSRGDFQIHYNSNDSYEPDFVVETETGKFLCEPKRANEMEDKTVIAKANGAFVWCQNATAHAQKTDNKEWTYLLIPHDKILDSNTLSGLAARYTFMKTD